MPFSVELSDQLKQKLTDVCDSFNVVPNSNVNILNLALILNALKFNIIFLNSLIAQMPYRLYKSIRICLRGVRNLLAHLLVGVRPQ